MKILIIRSYPSYMAVTNATYNIQEIGLAKALARKDHQCDVLLWTDKQEEVREVPVGGAGVVRVYYRRGCTALKNTVYVGCKELYDAYDILQPSEYNQIQSWLLAGKYPGKTVIYHGPYYCAFNKRYNLMCKVFDAFFLNRYRKLGTKFLTKSAMATDFLLSKGIREDNIATVGVGMDGQMLMSPKGQCDDLLYHQIGSDDSLKLLYIGKLESRRNIPFLLQVFQCVLKRHPAARLYIIGDGEESYKNKVRSLIEECGIKDRVQWQEKMEQKYLSQIYSCADFFLLPTRYEIFGMVLLEAMYYGNIVLTTQNGGSATLIRHGENGFVLDMDDADSWAERIISIYRNSVAMQEISDYAVKTVSNKYTWDALVDAFVKQYMTLAEL